MIEYNVKQITKIKQTNNDNNDKILKIGDKIRYDEII